MRNKSPQTLLFPTTAFLTFYTRDFYVKLPIFSNTRELNFRRDFALFYIKWDIKLISNSAAILNVEISPFYSIEQNRKSCRYGKKDYFAGK